MKWISVKDKLPEENEVVLIWKISGSAKIHDIAEYYGEIYGWEVIDIWDVTHWMPLPDPPKGE